MPQLVATMIMRHREKAGRAATKERKTERARRASLGNTDQTEETKEKRTSGLGRRVVVGDGLVVQDGEGAQAEVGAEQ